jgi:hypothetical protein
MALTVSILGALTTLLCAVLLLRQYLLARQKLLLWSGACFTVLTVSNVLLCLDLVTDGPDLYLARLASAALAMALLVYGLIWEAQRP